eukprot:GGOE01009079.1.p2 GENE.GGOE01009079.1~~GGOE01009079.1.p2  ORF type:complete len:216 (+),score=16.60 GGOE01009079.1:672-1319(+)
MWQLQRDVLYKHTVPTDQHSRWEGRVRVGGATGEEEKRPGSMGPFPLLPQSPDPSSRRATAPISGTEWLRAGRSEVWGKRLERERGGGGHLSSIVQVRNVQFQPECQEEFFVPPVMALLGSATAPVGQTEEAGEANGPKRVLAAGLRMGAWPPSHSAPLGHGVDPRLGRREPQTASSAVVVQARTRIRQLFHCLRDSKQQRGNDVVLVKVKGRKH